jgi:hypothetical protein
VANVYLIKPLEKKSIVWRVEMFRENTDGTISWFNINETYRWGQGFVDGELDCNLPYEGDLVAYAKNDCGWGSELEDSCAIDWEFSDDLTEEDQEFIKNCYYDGNPDDENVPDIGGAAWLFDGIHDWQVEDDYLEIIGPYQISLCDHDGTVIEENIKLKPRPDPRTSWPWSVDNPKPEDE